MTEKRFTLGVCENGLGLYDNVTKEQYLENDDIHLILLCEVLNTLNEENERLKKQLLENNCDNCKYSKAIYADVECRKKGLTEWKFNCDEFNGDLE